MNLDKRYELKRKIEKQLKKLIDTSWQYDVENQLRTTLQRLEGMELEKLL